MGNPFTSTSVSNYNSNPPPDDGSQVSNNIVAWSTIKTKLPDPIKTAFDTSETNTNNAFAKIIGGGGFTTTSTDYTVLLADQGKFIKATSAGITITTPDATSVGSPFVFIVLNNSSGSITLAGNNPGVQQNVDGVASVTIPSGAGVMLNTDATDWFSGGQQGVLVGKQLMYGDIINGTIAQSNATNAVTFSLKTLAGNDPSSSDPVLVCFRNATTTVGDYVYRSIGTATTLTISAGSTLGTANNISCRIWLVLFDDGGTVRLGAINCLSGTSIYPLGQMPIASSTAEGGAGAADSAQVFYTGTAVSSKAYVVLGRATYESGLSTAGNWNVDPRLQLYGLGVPLPGQLIQRANNQTGASTTGATAIPFDDTIPQNTEGDEYMTQAITPTSAANLLRISSSVLMANTNNGTNTAALFQDTTAGALTAASENQSNTSGIVEIGISYSLISGTTSSTTFKIRAGGSTGATSTFNGTSGNRKFGGVANSYLTIEEIVA